MQEPRRVRFLYQGILQVGVGFYHLQNGNWRGATGLLRNGAVRLREFETGNPRRRRGEARP